MQLQAVPLWEEESVTGAQGWEDKPDQVGVGSSCGLSKTNDPAISSHYSPPLLNDRQMDRVIDTMVFGYAYPAFHCFGMVEKNQANVEELQFWCRYWIIMAIVTTLERITDLLISWSPMYNELKLAFILYLWHPKTKGTAHVYETFLHPFIAQHENHIERKLAEWGDMAWDVAVFYCHHCAILGQAALFKLLHFLASQSEKFSESASKVRIHKLSLIHWQP
ncbi:hypothetical protein SAY87_008986 [Trapa incisa]|uniref:HVA22-like protein n=1 Tax=Trapa incisa TaxID=236973 RepID=A0AAN7JX78_9MYRT|nr:hypothetical protein SAY87_008986 [Trapa incisa]